jgi:blue copper oxidase
MDYVLDPTSSDVNTTIIYNRLGPTGNVYDPVYGFWGMNFCNLHFHGLQVSSSIEENHLPIDGGESKTYEFTIPDDLEPGTYFYHDHVHGKTSFAYMSGLMGSIIVDGDETSDLRYAPGIEGSREIVMMLSEGLVNPDGTVPPFFPIAMTFNWTGVTNGNIGQDTVYQVMQGETLHFRVTSASVEPTYRLSANETEFVVVANDGFVANNPQVTSTVTVGGGGRADFMARFDTPGTYVMKRAPWSPLPPGLEMCQIALGIPVYPCISYDIEQVVAIIEVQEDENFDPENVQPMVATIELPAQSSRVQELAQMEPVATKNIVLERKDGQPFFQIPASEESMDNMGGVPVAFGINNRLLTPTSRGGSVEAGTCELWDIESIPAGAEHPFHAHAATFMVKELDGIAVDEPYWLDTLVINVNATIHICFDHAIPGDVVLAHCHAPSHMDIGMGLLLDVIANDGGESSNGGSGDGDGDAASIHFFGILSTIGMMLTVSCML